MSRPERLLGGSRAREGVRGLPGYVHSIALGPLGMQVRGQGRGQNWLWTKAREAAGGLSGPRGGSGAPRVCPQHCIRAVRHASARARQGLE